MGRTPFEILKEHNKEMKERLRKPKTPLDFLRQRNLLQKRVGKHEGGQD